MKKAAKKKVEKKLKKTFLKPLKLSRLFLMVLSVTLGLFLILTIINFILLFVTNNQIKKDLNETNQKIKDVASSIDTVSSSTPPVSVPIKTPGEVLNSFGDHFSGVSFIDQTKSNMNLDANTTAFTFPPLYSFSKTESAASPDKKAALKLKVVGKSLYYKGIKLKLPSELETENILNINVDLIGSRFLVGIVTGQSYDEKVFVYFFDGQIFTPIITQTTPQKIELKFERSGGSVAFGGTEDNFLIVYGGYNGHIFYYYNGTLTDVSQFFGLRVTIGGFRPQIISRESSRGTLFYMCSQTEGKPKLVKLWSKNPGELMGALDFSPLLFPNSFGAVKATCAFDGADVLMTINKSEGATETWRFVDNGFDNSQDRQVVSTDIGQGRDNQISSAIISEIGLNSDENKSEIFLSDLPAQTDWQVIKPNVWHTFEAPTTSLFWKVSFQSEPDSPDYSPWFDDINQLGYKTN